MECGGCRFYLNGECRRFPPLNGFPTVRSDSWCGEWKEVKQDASSVKEAETGYGDSGARAIETLQPEQGPQEDEQIPTERLRFDAREETAQKVQEALEVRKRGWPKGKPRK